MRNMFLLPLAALFMTVGFVCCGSSATEPGGSGEKQYLVNRKSTRLNSSH